MISQTAQQLARQFTNQLVIEGALTQAATFCTFMMVLSQPDGEEGDAMLLQADKALADLVREPPVVEAMAAQFKVKEGH